MDNFNDFMDSEIKKLVMLQEDLRRQMRVNKLIEELREDMMNVKSKDDLSDFIYKHLEILNSNPKLFKHVETAKKRLNGMNEVSHKFWNNLN